MRERMRKLPCVCRAWLGEVRVYHIKALKRNEFSQSERTAGEALYRIKSNRLQLYFLFFGVSCPVLNGRKERRRSKRQKSRRKNEK